MTRRPWSREDAEEHGYTERCVNCGRIGDTSWCGCPPDPNEPDEEEEV